MEIMSHIFWWTGFALWGSAGAMIGLLVGLYFYRIPRGIVYAIRFLKSDMAIVASRKFTAKDKIGLLWFCVTTPPRTMDRMLKDGPVRSRPPIKG